MKHKLFELYRKYKLAIVIGLSIIVVGLIGIILFLTLGNNSSIKEYKNNNYIVKYDNSWKINSKEDNLIILEHERGSKLSIEIIELQEEYKFSNMEDMLDELLYDIETQNKDFKLLYKEKDSITKNKYEGYRMLYENADSQAMVVVAKKSDKLIMFTYEAKNNYFDILLDSVQNIIYDFDTVEEKFDLTHNLNIETKEISYGEDETVVSLLKNTTQQEIATNNYHVKYSIPSNFKVSMLNSQIGSFNFEGLEEGKMSITVNLYNRNIYEYLDKEKSLNVYSEYKYYKTDEEYSKYTESIDKFDSDFESYIYKCSYYYDKAIEYGENFEINYTSELKDNIILIYALDRNHILLIKIESSKVAIPKKLIDMIKIDSSNNYSSFSDSTKENGMIKSVLKRHVGYEDKLEEITIKLPEKYKEIDKNLNVYEKRNYSLDYNDELEIYNYDVEYSLTSEYLKLESQVSNISSSFPRAYGDYKELTYSGEQNINGKNFVVYDGGYTDISGIMFTSTNRVRYYVNVKVLFYKLENGGYLTIELEGNGNQISNELLNEITNFEIKN
ncbi:MAG: hypothetical protein E7166_06435 [Firmicutes bacterium]|nr:hypothetical protein [Bacillota bacterium]